MSPTAPRLPVAPPSSKPVYRTSAGRVVASVVPPVTLDEYVLVRTEQGEAPPTPPIPTSDPGVQSTWDDLDGSLDPTPEPVPRAVAPGRQAAPSSESGSVSSGLVALGFVAGALSAAGMAVGVLLGTLLVAGGATAYVLSADAPDLADATFIIMPENRPGVDDAAASLP